MTTRLNGNKTFFLPFNRGDNPGEVQYGAGNPLHSSGHRTGYFWEETLQKDRLFFEQIKEKAINNDTIIQTASANPLDKFELGIKKLIENLMIQRMSDNEEIVTKYMDDKEFQDAVFPILAKEIYEKITEPDEIE